MKLNSRSAFRAVLVIALGLVITVASGRHRNLRRSNNHSAVH
jgi:hypothetical protein